MSIAASKGKRLLFRTGAAFVSTRLGIDGIPPISAHELGIDRSLNKHGGLIIAGSYVPKTTAQLKVLVEKRGEELKIVVMDVERLLASGEGAENMIEEALQVAENELVNGEDVLVMTSRKLITGSDDKESLNIGGTVGRALLDLVEKLKVRPRYVIAKVSVVSVGKFPVFR